MNQHKRFSLPGKFIDVHCHKDSSSGDIISVRNLFPSENPGDSGFYSIGLHPWHVKPDILFRDLEKVKSLSGKKGIIAIGECGLDRLTETPFELQEEAFAAQIKIAEEYGKPLIIHAVRTYPEIISAKKKMKSAVPWILHGFNGNPQTAEQLVKNSFYLSFGSSIIGKKGRLADILADLPEELLFLETDGKRCNIQDVYRAAAEIRKTDVSGLQAAIMDNFRKAFKVEIL